MTGRFGGNGLEIYDPLKDLFNNVVCEPATGAAPAISATITIAAPGMGNLRSMYIHPFQDAERSHIYSD